MYQPILMKDLGKTKSPVNDLNEIELYASIRAHDNGDDENGGVGDDERKLTEQVMDKHLSQLESNSIGKPGNTLYDIAQYMAKLKENHMQLELPKSESKETAGSGASDADTTADEANKSDENMGGAAFVQSSEDERPAVVIDKRVDKVFKSDKANQKQDTKSPHKHVQQSKSPDRNKLSGSSPIKIVKVRSPRNSLDADTVILTRRNSRERSISPKTRRTGDASVSKAGDGVPGGGILKRNPSPGVRKSRSSPDRQCSPSISRRSLSPRTSFESRSPERHHLGHFSAHSRNIDAYAHEQQPVESYYADLSFARGPNKRHQVYSNQSSFESKSPVRDRKRSMSAHSTFGKCLSPEPSFQYYYGCETPHSHSSERGKKRVSKSLERCSSKDSNGSYRRGYSPERIYHIDQPMRSHSAESPYTKQSGAVFVSRSNESLTRLIEHPTCIECLYQRKPS